MLSRERKTKALIRLRACAFVVPMQQNQVFSLWDQFTNWVLHVCNPNPDLSEAELAQISR